MNILPVYAPEQVQKNKVGNLEQKVKDQLKEQGYKIPPLSNLPDDLYMNAKLL